MFSYWAYILIGNDKTGKTSFQKYLVEELCEKQYKKLPRNLISEIVHPRMPRAISTLSTMNRSYQEKIDEYGDVASYFDSFFKTADICVLSSHTHSPADQHLQEMINQLHARAFNVAAVFFSNGFDAEAEIISMLTWDERLWVDNPDAASEEQIQNQLARRAREFASMLVSRASLQ